MHAKKAKLNDEKFIIFEIAFQIFDVNDKTKVKAQILQYRRYKEFENFHSNLWTIYQPKEITLPLLPPKHVIINVEPLERRKDLQIYCTKILNIEKITNFDVFYDFFLLNDIEFKEKAVIYDYRDLTIYDFVTELEKRR